MLRFNPFTRNFDFVGSGGSGGGSGDVVGPASSVDNRIATFDGTTGKLIQDSGELLSGLVHTTGNETIAGIKTIANNTWRTQGSFGLYGQTLLVDNPGDALLFQAGQAKGDGNTGGSIQIEGGAADSSGGLNGDGGPANVIGGQGFGTGNGGVARVKSGPGGDAGNPGETLIEGGDAGATDQAGADVLLKGGTPNGSGLYGKIKMQTQSTYATTFNNNDSTANHEIVIPDADGTLVLSSELADYALDADVVHLTGDEHISGKKSFNSGLYDHIGSNVRSIDTSGRQLVNQDGEIILDWSANAIEFHDPLSGQQLTFDTTLLGASRTVTLQDGDGTLAFLSDLSGGSSTPKIIIPYSFESYTTGRYDSSLTDDGSIYINQGGITADTGTTDGSKSMLLVISPVGTAPKELIYDKNLELQFLTQMANRLDQSCISQITTGSTMASNTGVLTDKHIGFIADIGGTHKLYASNANGTTQTKTDIVSGINIDDINTLRIVMNGSTDIKFYVNGVLKATHTTNLPSGALTSNIMNYGVKLDSGTSGSSVKHTNHGGNISWNAE